MASRGLAVALAGLLLSACTLGRDEITPRPDGASVAPRGVLSIDKTALEFDAVVVGESSDLRFGFFTISNIGDGITGTAVVTVTGDFVVHHTCGASALAAGARCNASVIFKPAGPGLRTGTLTASAAPGGTVSATLSGTGLAPGDLIITPDHIAFPPTAVFANGGSQTVTIGNSDAAARTISVSVADSTNFVVNSACKGALVPRSSCTASVTFTPFAVGEKRTSLTITADGRTQVVPLSGTGLFPARVIVQPTTIDFAGVVDQRSPPVAVIVVNAGDVASALPIVTLSGPAANDFVFDDHCAVPLASRATCTIDVVFRPTVVGMRSASLDVWADTGGTATVTLTGTAAASTGPAPDAAAD